MLDDNTDIKSLIKKMNHNPKSYFLFNPQGHYVNAMSIYSAFKRSLDAKHYGTVSKKQSNTAKAKMHDEDAHTSFKGTAFHNCEIPYDVFHMGRRTKLSIKQSLSRLGFLMLRDGSLEVKDTHDKKPELVNAAEIVGEMAQNYQLASAFAKPDFFVPVPVIEGMASAESLHKAGIQIHCLDSRLVYPQYGVWAATSQEYLSLLSNYV